MMASGRVPDYLGGGVIADRPATPTLAPDTIGLWWATDTEVLSVWDGAAWTDAGGSIGMTNPMTTAGDLIRGGVAGAPTRLAIGANGQVLTVTAGALAWGAAGSGDVVGPGSSVDNTLPRFDSTTGKLLQGSGVAVTDLNEISGYLGNINRQTGTSYTLVAADSGKIVELANAASIALTADPTLPAGFCCTLVQALAGVATVASTGSGTVVNRQSQFTTAGENAMCTIYVRSNSGSNAVFVFGGDTA
jgi:hypothetical protein